MATLALTVGGDLDLSSGNLRFVTDPAEALAIKLQKRFQLWLGEWFLDTRQGVPYRELVLVKNPNLGVIRQLFRQIFSTTQGIKSIDQFNLDYSASARRASFDFRVTTDTGAVIVGGEGKPFIVERPVLP